MRVTLMLKPCLIAASVAIATLPAPASARMAPVSSHAPEHAMPEEVKQSIGCLLTGTVGVIGAAAAGGENLINIIAGGVVVPQNRAVLYIGLAGVVFASFCAVGQALTPVWLYYTEPAPDAAQPPMPANALVHATAAQPVALPSVASRHGILARTAETASVRFERATPASAPIPTAPSLFARHATPQ